MDQITREEEDLLRKSAGKGRNHMGAVYWRAASLAVSEKIGLVRMLF
jgi:hypothetical protein